MEPGTVHFVWFVIGCVVGALGWAMSGPVRRSDVPDAEVLRRVAGMYGPERAESCRVEKEAWDAWQTAKKAVRARDVTVGGEKA